MYDSKHKSSEWRRDTSSSSSGSSDSSSESGSSSLSSSSDSDDEEEENDPFNELLKAHGDNINLDAKKSESCQKIKMNL